MDLELALHDLHAVELRLEKLYAWLAEVFADNADAAELFTRMSREERSHAELVQSQIRLVAADKEAVVDMEHVTTWEEIRALIARVDDLHARPLPPTLEEALAASIEFEGHGAELYSVRTLVHGRKEIRELLERLSEANKEHHARLLAFARRQDDLLIG